MIKPHKNADCEIDNGFSQTIIEGKTNRVILNGYWIWWCYKHKQPLAWCEKDKIQQELNALKEKSKKC